MTESESVPDGERAAGIITRGMAAVIDLVVVLLMMSGLYGGLILVRLVYSPAAFSLPSLTAVFSTLVTFVIAVLYLTGCWTVSGSTAGAVAMGLRVVGRRSQRVRLLIALLRAIGCVLFPIGLLWVVIDRRRRSLQDIVFRTRVVYSRPVAG
ncbi:MAG TPA: RDD family protein [Mycobacterium sp.]|nr:RDD family protein [Mycobacterium sp.]